MKYIYRFFIFSISKHLLQIIVLPVLFFSLLQTGCSKKTEIQPYDKQGYKNPAIIYLLSDTPDQGKDDRGNLLHSIKDFSSIASQEIPFTPWPQALRISDIAETEDGTIVISINKRGVITFREPGVFLSEIAHESFTDYTSGKIITDHNFVLCQVYTDSFFNNNLSVPKSPLVEINIDTKKSINSRHNYPAATNNLSLINLKKIDDKWFSAWKKSDTTGTSFKYFIHNNPLGENAAEITESKFMFANKFLNKSNLPDNLKDFISKITKVEINNNSIIEVEVRSRDSEVLTIYLLGVAGSTSSHYEKMCISAEPGKYFISYRGEIYILEDGNSYLFSGVEKLPNNYNYTVLYASNDILYAAWEQQRFFLSGACGLSLIDKKRVDKIPQ